MRIPSIYNRGGRQRLERVREQLRRKDGLKHGIVFDMMDFVSLPLEHEPIVNAYGETDYKTIPQFDEQLYKAFNRGRTIPAPCGTTACIGGCVVLNDRGGKIQRNVSYGRETIKLVLNKRHPNFLAAEDVLDNLMTNWSGNSDGPWKGLYSTSPKNAAKAITAALRMIDRLQTVKA